MDLSTLAPGQFHVTNHHAVLKDSPTTPVRVVFDYSCKTETGISVNDCLEIGPPLQNDLVVIRIRFRRPKVAITSDLEKAFHMVGLHRLQRNLFIFLYLSDHSDPNSPFKAYRFRVLPFGANCSPFVLGIVIRDHLERSGHPVAQDLLRDCYVDNIATGRDTPQLAVKFYEDSTVVMKKAGFNLRQWTTNDRQVFSKIHPGKEFGIQGKITILGMVWDPVADDIGFRQLTLAPYSRPDATKRDVLAATATLFDPEGLLSPVTISAKLLIQQLWKKKLKWDIPLPPDVAALWSDLAKDLEEATKIRYRRGFFKSGAQPKIVHIFVDASKRAYGACVFLCDGKESTLVLAKARVAPLKELTLPQLELMAAFVGILLALLIFKVFEELGIQLVFHLWSDSQITLYWLESTKKKPPFVQARVDKIGAFTRQLGAVWHYCPTADNPADLLTRGLRFKDFVKNALWWNGPSWINDVSLWPVWTPTSALTIALLSVEEDIGERNEKVAAKVEGGIDVIMSIERFATLNRLLRVTALVLRFVDNCRAKPTTKKSGPLTAEELVQAEFRWIVAMQRSSYPEELAYFESKRPGKRPAIVRQLDVIQRDGILRVGGRMERSDLSPAARNPILLPQAGRFTQLVVEDVHRRNHHSGPAATLAALRQAHWIPSGRQRIRTILRKCIPCNKVISRAYRAPDHAPLPSERVVQSRAFSGIGIDLTGAVHVIGESGAIEKVYIVLFICTASRAVHLEVAEDLSAISFLEALTRFCNRRSSPEIIITDNATNFESSARHLKRLFEDPTVAEFCATKGIRWKFIVKRAPWHGGFYERLIGSVKTSIRKVIGKQKITAKELRTLVTDVEAFLNDRPLTYVSPDLSDGEPLTPSHLLMGHRIIRLPIASIPDDFDPADPTYGMLQDELAKWAVRRALLLDQMWRRWTHEYLTALREFHQATVGQHHETIRTGDIVLVHDELPRFRWKMAIATNSSGVRTAKYELPSYEPKTAGPADPCRSCSQSRCEPRSPHRPNQKLPHQLENRPSLPPKKLNLGAHPAQPPPPPRRKSPSWRPSCNDRRAIRKI